MKKIEVTLMLGAVMSGWGYPVVPEVRMNKGGGAVVNGDPLPDDEWN